MDNFFRFAAVLHILFHGHNFPMISNFRNTMMSQTGVLLSGHFLALDLNDENEYLLFPIRDETKRREFMDSINQSALRCHL